MTTETEFVSSRTVDWNNIEEVRTYITRWANNTFPGRTAKNAVTKLGLEELPELFVALRDPKISIEELGREFADTLILLFDLASLLGINIASALRDKMEINEHRMWLRDESGIAHHVVPEIKVDQKGYSNK